MATLCVFLMMACGFDYWKKRIPNHLLAMMTVVGIWQAGLNGGVEGILYFLCKMICMIVCMFFLFKIGALGAGDVKLFGVCAGYLPGDKILHFLFYSLLIAAVISLVKILTEHSAKERLVYLGEYILGVIQCGSWQLYMENQREQQRCGICLAGPILGSALMWAGGIY